jgi:adenine phosphoribosyltransferase
MASPRVFRVRIGTDSDFSGIHDNLLDRVYGRCPDWLAAVEARAFSSSTDVVLGIESRGFIVGAAVAHALGTGLTLVRKPGKLPSQTYRAHYELEYGTDTLEIHHDALGHGSRVLLLDDLLATGGTAAAAVELVRQCHGSIVACAFVIELGFLNGRQRLDGYEVRSLIRYDQP